MTASNDLISPVMAPPGADGDWAWYAPLPGALDEAFDPTGQPRSHWRPFLEALRHLGLCSLTRRWNEVKHLIRENGVTYNVYADPRGLERPWQLDPIPFLIAPADGQLLEKGLVQRGRLLEAILQDLYGPQDTLRAGLLPPELVFGNPGFLRSCHNIDVAGGRHLHLYAANIGRSADGCFWVLGDRTQCPSGAGYALENRIVLSRMLPDIFRDCRVQRLALFFRTLQGTLAAVAPHNRDNPRIVLLTPGPYNETYFEHAYLARYLGYTLVEGGDLTVRDNHVFLKVLGGLQPVDVILRRLDDDFCDPLELRHDSFLGVPGLVQAVRSGNVAVANALGSGLLETPALLAFLPGLCQRLLGEELVLPSVPTWWCGQPRELSHVLAHLDDMVIKPALPGMRMEPVFAAELEHAARETFIEKIKAAPHAYVGQQRLTLATTPALAGERFEPRHVVLRAFLAAKGDSYVVMRGGLTRVGGAAESMVVSMQRGGGSKDTWVLSDQPVDAFSLLPPDGQRLELTRGGSDLPSRVADNLFWLGRYAERAEGLTRLLRAALERLTEIPGLGEAPELPALMRALINLTTPPEPAPGGPPPRLATPEAELFSLIHDSRRPGSLAAVLFTLSRVVGAVRDRISSDMWRVLSDLGKVRRFRALFFAADAGADRPAGERAGPPRAAANGENLTLSEELDLLDRTVLTLAAFGGLAMESVTRGEGWRFLDMGRKLERSLHNIALLRSTLVHVTPNEGPLLEALLEIADSSMTYRRRYQGSLQTAAVLDLLVADESNPRSLAFQLAALADDVDHLPRDRALPGRSPEQRLMLASLTEVRLADMTHLVRADEQADRRSNLDALLTHLADALPALSEALTRTYLSHLQTSRHLGTIEPSE